MACDIILGAGLAGLAAGISLLEKGREVLLIEANEKLAVKTCGEFLSFDALPLLEGWGIIPHRKIERVHFHGEDRSFTFDFPSPCATMPRLDLENALLNLFIKKGGQIQFSTKRDPSSFSKENVILSSGRWQGVKNVKPKYVGIKNHFMAPPREDLHMYVTPKCYFGISSITDDKTVLSCLAKPTQNPEEFIFRQLEKIPSLRDLSPLFQPWLTAPIGEFGIKKVTPRPRTYLLGDAQATIAPLSGAGMTIALTSGRMAADFIIKDEWREFPKAWRQRYKTRIRLANALNPLFFRPDLLFPLLRSRTLVTQFFRWTREGN